MAACFPGLATHTLAGLCALRLLSAASSSENLHKSAKPQPPQTICHALPKSPPVQAQPFLLYTAEAAFDLAVPYGMPRTGPPSHWQGSVRCGCRVLPPPLKISTNRQNRYTHKPPAQHPYRSPQCRPYHNCCTLQRLHLTLQCPMVCPGQATHTLAGFCCALWLPSAASSFS